MKKFISTRLGLSMPRGLKIIFIVRLYLYLYFVLLFKNLLFFFFFSIRFVLFYFIYLNFRDNFYRLEYSKFWRHLHCYTYNVSADMSFGLLQVFHVELESLRRTSARTPGASSKWNHLEVAGSIPTTGQNNKEYFLQFKTCTRSWLTALEVDPRSSSRFCVDIRVRHETPEEGRRT